MHSAPLLHTVFLVFTGAAVLATMALAARQSLLVAYILLGVLLGPGVTGLVPNAELVAEISHIGIMFLLFLLGLDLDPRGLWQGVKRTTLVTVVSSAFFALAGWTISLAFGFTPLEAAIIGGGMCFSSTIIGLKLLPTTVLHHQRMGEVIIGILLLQDLIAIAMLLLIQGAATGGGTGKAFLLLPLALPALILVAWGGARWLILPLIGRYDTIREYIFLLAIGWCLGFAELSASFGLSAEIGAFIAGVTLAASPIAQFIVESLKPLRDFFLVLFFFSVGAQFDVRVLDDVLPAALAFAGVALLLKPATFAWLLEKTGDPRKRSWEIGFRLGQMSEFSMLLAALALDMAVISERASYTVQLATILTFVASSYLVVLRFPTPIAISDELRRD